MITLKLSLALLSLLSLTFSQETIDQSSPVGTYRPIKKQSRSVPRMYLCGAGVWHRQEMVPQPNHCYSHCDKKRKWTGKSYCSWQRRCDPVAPILGWIRVDGIKFQYCHFQYWGQQITMEERGSWNWLGMQMCPQNQYVYGIRTKLTARDGLAGLILLCRNMKNSKEVSERLVFDGEGTWMSAGSSANFAVGFKAKFKDSFISGLGLEMAGLPFIYAFDFKYQFPKDFHAAPQQIDNIVVYNYAPTEMRKEIELSKEKEFQRIWQNEKEQLHGVSLTNSVSKSFTTKIRIGVPYMSQSRKQTTTYEMAQTSRQQSVDKFKFGVVETYRMGQKQRDVVFVPACTKYVIRQIVYFTDVDIPYKLEVAYTNGIENEYQVIHGWYRGVTTSEVETSVHYQKLC